MIATVSSARPSAWSAQRPRALADEQDRGRPAAADSGPARAGAGDDRDLAAETLSGLQDDLTEHTPGR
jgi:hypothetical protein